MKIDLSKTSHILLFVVTLPILSLGVGWCFARLLPNAPFWVETISPLAAYGLLYTFFERFAWHWPIFRLLGIIEVPDLRGRWEGKQLSSYKDKQGKPITSYVVMEIAQTFSEVTVRTYYHRWNDGGNASCFLNIDAELCLVVIFASEPNARHSGEDGSNKGVVRLRYAYGLLLGTYFNTNGNYGEMRLKRTDKTLLHRFTP